MIWHEKTFYRTNKNSPGCESWQKYAKDIKLTLPATVIGLCESKCCQCIDLKDVCDQCEDADFTPYMPLMRPCKRFIESN